MTDAPSPTAHARQLAGIRERAQSNARAVAGRKTIPRDDARL